MDHWEVVRGRVIELAVGDITRMPADAIVNAANNHLGGGGGVDGAIHRAGGPAILADLTRRYGPIGVRTCPTGSAVISDAGDLPARWVVHTVGPIWLDEVGLIREHFARFGDALPAAMAASVDELEARLLAAKVPVGAA